MKSENSYDFIIAGAGCAGLSLLYYLLQNKQLQHSSILVLDKQLQKSNDRTWCFWEEGSGPFETLVTKKWDTISVHKGNTDTVLPTAPYQYKMIQGHDFYAHVLDVAHAFPTVTFKEVVVDFIDVAGGVGIVKWGNETASAKYVFSSILQIDTLYNLSQTKLPTPFLWQHFKGRLVNFEKPVFNENIARLMDFNVAQHGATAFMYVLPLTAHQALVEYTIFSSQLLKEAEYDAAIDTYLHTAFADATYSITHTEMGAIPMTLQKMDFSKAPVFVIGTLGNAVKASTGYAFQFIQQQTSQIVKQLENNSLIETEVHTTRHNFYDAVLLSILKNNKMEGSEIFSRIFKKNNSATIFKFLSNTSSLLEDIRIMRSLPTRIFLPAAIRVLLRR